MPSAVSARPEVGHRADLAPLGDGRPVRLEESPLGQAVLGQLERVRAGPDGHGPVVERLDEVERHVLQLVGHDGAAVGQPSRGLDVVISADLDAIRHGGGRAGGIGIEDRDAIAHRPGRRGPASARAARRRGCPIVAGGGIAATRKPSDL